jgi:hypothetical protein
MYRNLTISILILLLMLVLHNCELDKLELHNPNQMVIETYFKNESEVQQAVNAIYTSLQTRGLYQRAIFFAMDNMAYEQLMNCCAEYDKLQYTRYSFGPDHGAIGEYWKSCYAGIRKANFVINSASVINEIGEGILPFAKKQKYLGEAYFLRAFYYFHLVTRFGDIPLVTEYSGNNHGLPRSPARDIWQLIEEDLTFAAENCLPNNLEEKGRATSGAAWSLLGKAHLFQGNVSSELNDFELAKSAFLHVINDENYSLEDRYLNNFEEETEYGPESIFEVGFNATLGYSNVWSTGDDASGYNECTFRAKEYGFRDWFNVYPYDNLLDEFEPGEPRYGYCFYSMGDVYNNGLDTVKWLGEKRAAWRKYQNYYKMEWEESGSGINTRVIRLADVLLMMAEVENFLGNKSEAIGYLNQVRNRTDVMMPNYGTPDMDTIYPVSDYNLILKAIEHERKVELCGEQVRFDDLVRWRRLDEFIMVEIIPYLDIFVRQLVRFDPAKHYLWPIPQSEIDKNQALSEDDQNPGY